MRTKLAAVAIGGVSMLGGGVVGLALGAPHLALAQDAAPAVDDPTATTVPEGDDTTAEDATRERHPFDDRVRAALDGLVDDGTLTREQADAVVDALREARPDRLPRRHIRHVGPGIGVALDAAAEALGMTGDELRDALRDGRTIAELAEERGVDVATVVDALVAAATERIDQAVEDGRIDEDCAEDLKAALEERITDLVEDGRPFAGPGPRGPRGPWIRGPWAGRDAGRSDTRAD